MAPKPSQAKLLGHHQPLGIQALLGQTTPGHRGLIQPYLLAHNHLAVLDLWAFYPNGLPQPETVAALLSELESLESNSTHSTDTRSEKTRSEKTRSEKTQGSPLFTAPTQSDAQTHPTSKQNQAPSSTPPTNLPTVSTPVEGRSSNPQTIPNPTTLSNSEAPTASTPVVDRLSNPQVKPKSTTPSDLASNQTLKPSSNPVDVDFQPIPVKTYDYTSLSSSSPTASQPSLQAKLQGKSPISLTGPHPTPPPQPIDRPRPTPPSAHPSPQSQISSQPTPRPQPQSSRPKPPTQSPSTHPNLANKGTSDSANPFRTALQQYFDPSQTIAESPQSSLPTNLEQASLNKPTASTPETPAFRPTEASTVSGSAEHSPNRSAELLPSQSTLPTSTPSSEPLINQGQNFDGELSHITQDQPLKPFTSSTSSTDSNDSVPSLNPLPIQGSTSSDPVHKSQHPQATNNNLDPQTDKKNVDVSTATNHSEIDPAQQLPPSEKNRSTKKHTETSQNKTPSSIPLTASGSITPQSQGVDTFSVTKSSPILPPASETRVTHDASPSITSSPNQGTATNLELTESEVSSTAPSKKSQFKASKPANLSHQPSMGSQPNESPSFNQVNEKPHSQSSPSIQETDQNTSQFNPSAKTPSTATPQIAGNPSSSTIIPQPQVGLISKAINGLIKLLSNQRPSPSPSPSELSQPPSQDAAPMGAISLDSAIHQTDPESAEQQSSNLQQLQDNQPQDKPLQDNQPRTREHTRSPKSSRPLATQVGSVEQTPSHPMSSVEAGAFQAHPTPRASDETVDQIQSQLTSDQLTSDQIAQTQTPGSTNPPSLSGQPVSELPLTEFSANVQPTQSKPSQTTHSFPLGQAQTAQPQTTQSQVHQPQIAQTQTTPTQAQVNLKQSVESLATQPSTDSHQPASTDTVQEQSQSHPAETSFDQTTAFPIEQLPINSSQVENSAINIAQLQAPQTPLTQSIQPQISQQIASNSTQNAPSQNVPDQVIPAQIKSAETVQSQATQSQATQSQATQSLTGSSATAQEQSESERLQIEHPQATSAQISPIQSPKLPSTQPTPSSPNPSLSSTSQSERTTKIQAGRLSQPVQPQSSQTQTAPKSANVKDQNALPKSVPVPTDQDQSVQPQTPPPIQPQQTTTVQSQPEQPLSSQSQLQRLTTSVPGTGSIQDIQPQSAQDQTPPPPQTGLEQSEIEQPEIEQTFTTSIPAVQPPTAHSQKVQPSGDQTVTIKPQPVQPLTELSPVNDHDSLQTPPLESISNRPETDQTQGSPSQSKWANTIEPLPTQTQDIQSSENQSSAEHPQVDLSTSSPPEAGQSSAVPVQSQSTPQQRVELPHTELYPGQPKLAPIQSQAGQTSPDLAEAGQLQTGQPIENQTYGVQPQTTYQVSSEPSQTFRSEPEVLTTTSPQTDLPLAVESLVVAPQATESTDTDRPITNGQTIQPPEPSFQSETAQTTTRPTTVRLTVNPSHPIQPLPAAQPQSDPSLVQASQPSPTNVPQPSEFHPQIVPVQESQPQSIEPHTIQVQPVQDSAIQSPGIPPELSHPGSPQSETPPHGPEVSINVLQNQEPEPESDSLSIQSADPTTTTQKNTTTHTPANSGIATPSSPLPSKSPKPLSQTTDSVASQISSPATGNSPQPPSTQPQSSTTIAPPSAENHISPLADKAVQHPQPLQQAQSQFPGVSPSNQPNSAHSGNVSRPTQEASSTIPFKEQSHPTPVKRSELPSSQQTLQSHPDTSVDNEFGEPVLHQTVPLSTPNPPVFSTFTDIAKYFAPQSTVAKSSDIIPPDSSKNPENQSANQSAEHPPIVPIAPKRDQPAGDNPSVNNPNLSQDSSTTPGLSSTQQPTDQAPALSPHPDQIPRSKDSSQPSISSQSNTVDDRTSSVSPNAATPTSANPEIPSGYQAASNPRSTSGNSVLPSAPNPNLTPPPIARHLTNVPPSTAEGIDQALDHNRRENGSSKGDIDPSRQTSRKETGNNTPPSLSHQPSTASQTTLSQKVDQSAHKPQADDPINFPKLPQVLKKLGVLQSLTPSAHSNDASTTHSLLLNQKAIDSSQPSLTAFDSSLSSAPDGLSVPVTQPSDKADPQSSPGSLPPTSSIEPTTDKVPQTWSSLADLIGQTTAASANPSPDTINRSPTQQTGSTPNQQGTQNIRPEDQNKNAQKKSPKKESQSTRTNPTPKTSSPPTKSKTAPLTSASGHTLIQRTLDDGVIQRSDSDGDEATEESDNTVYENPAETAKYLEMLAQEMYGLIKQRLALEQERYGSSNFRRW